MERFYTCAVSDASDELHVCYRQAVALWLEIVQASLLYPLQCLQGYIYVEPKRYISLVFSTFMIIPTESLTEWSVSRQP